MCKCMKIEINAVSFQANFEKNVVSFQANFGSPGSKKPKFLQNFEIFGKNIIWVTNVVWVRKSEIFWNFGSISFWAHFIGLESTSKEGPPISPWPIKWAQNEIEQKFQKNSLFLTQMNNFGHSDYNFSKFFENFGFGVQNIGFFWGLGIKNLKNLWGSTFCT